MEMIIIKHGIPKKWGSRTILECNYCHNHFEVKNNVVNYGKGCMFCNHSCQAKYFFSGKPAWNKGLKGFRAGSLNNMWKGGFYFSKVGYKYIYKKDHPNCTKLGYVLEHRLVMEKKLGRFLSTSEIVHHINGVVDDNRPENLEVMSQSEHVGVHFGLNGKWAKKYDKCIECDTTDNKHCSLGYCKKCYRQEYYKKNSK